MATPKSKSGPVEVIRTLRVARASAVRTRTQAFNNLVRHDPARNPISRGSIKPTARTSYKHSGPVGSSSARCSAGIHVMERKVNSDEEIYHERRPEQKYHAEP